MKNQQIQYLFKIVSLEDYQIPLGNSEQEYNLGEIGKCWSIIMI